MSNQGQMLGLSGGPTLVLQVSIAAVGSPRPIPLRKGLLSQVRAMIWYHQPQLCSLHLWPFDRSLCSWCAVWDKDPSSCNVCRPSYPAYKSCGIRGSMLKVYVGAITVNRTLMAGQSVEKNDLAAKFTLPGPGS